MERLDQYLANKYRVSRSLIQKLFRLGEITCPVTKIKPSTPITDVDLEKIIVKIPKSKNEELVAENIALQIIFEDMDLAVVVKPKAMVVHTAAGHSCGTLVNALLFHFDRLSTLGGQFRPGIVHRLDKDTEGLLIIAKTDRAYMALVKMFKERKIEKRYRALLSGVMSAESGVIEKNISRSLKDRKKMTVVTNGKPAVTYYQKLKVVNNHTLVDICLPTGRTHQIRVHFASIGFPLVGDPVYQRRKHKGQGQFLIAYYLKFKHPFTGNQLEFQLDLPPWAK